MRRIVPNPRRHLGWTWVFAVGFLWLTAILRVSKATDPLVPTVLVGNVSPAPAEKPADEQAGKPGQAPQTPQAAQAGATYVGDADCATCHTKQHDGYVNTAHNRKSDPRTPGAAKSCETCHGPASKHLEDPTEAKFKPKSFKNAKPQEVNALCTTCHNKGEHA